jgi:myo-inositol-1(or 4)-monophosphatase
MALDLAALRACIEEAARKGGACALREQAAGRGGVYKEKAGQMDIVTLADVAAQAAIYEVVQAHFPEAVASGLLQFLGEESVEAGSAASAAALASMVDAETLIIADPIDGTTMFAHGIATWVVSIGVAVRGTLVAGAIYHPGADELFSAATGQGATVNGQPMRVSSEVAMRNALFGYGLHNTPHVAATMCRAVTGLVQVARGCRSLGSAALHLAYVAAGRLTGFTELDLNSWDLAAGVLLIQEAGGRVTDTRGGAYTLATRDVLATNGAVEVHEGCEVVLRAMGAEAPDAAAAHAAPGAAAAAFAAWAAAPRSTSS